MQLEKNIKIASKILENYFSSFLNSIKHRSEETIGTYKRSLREFIKWHKHEKAFHFRVIDVEKYKKYLAEKRKLSSNSVSTYLTALRQFFNFLTNNGAITQNPTENITCYLKPKKRNKTTINEKQIEKYLNSINRVDERSYRDFAISKLILSLGLQEIEIVRSNIGDYKKIETRSILFIQGKGKKNKDASVELVGDVKQALEDYLTFRRYSQDHEPLFMSAGNRTRGKRMTSRGIRERINLYLKLSGLKKQKKLIVTAYSLRHAAAKILATNGLTPEELQKKFRIGKLSTALNYYE